MTEKKKYPQHTWLPQGSTDSYGLGEKQEKTLDLVAGVCLEAGIDPEKARIKGHAWRKNERKKEKAKMRKFEEDLEKEKEKQKERLKKVQESYFDQTPIFADVNENPQSVTKWVNPPFGQRFRPLDVLLEKNKGEPLSDFDPEKDFEGFRKDIFERWVSDNSMAASVNREVIREGAVAITVDQPVFDTFGSPQKDKHGDTITIPHKRVVGGVKKVGKVRKIGKKSDKEIVTTSRNYTVRIPHPTENREVVYNITFGWRF